MPRVSVIIPTFNRARFIGLAIESVLQQTYQDFEIIVVDDGSTDDTRDRLEAYSDCICYHYQTNAGPSAARNVGVRTSTGEVVAFLDSDDIWLPGKLHKQIAVFDNDPHVGLVHTQVEIIAYGPEPLAL